MVPLYPRRVGRPWKRFFVLSNLLITDLSTDRIAPGTAIFFSERFDLLLSCRCPFDLCADLHLSLKMDFKFSHRVREPSLHRSTRYLYLAQIDKNSAKFSFAVSQVPKGRDNRFMRLPEPRPRHWLNPGRGHLPYFFLFLNGTPVEIGSSTSCSEFRPKARQRCNYFWNRSRTRTRLASTRYEPTSYGKR